MSTVLLIIQLIISVILTGLILIQRSEGGALGIGGGGGGGGGFMSGRSATTSIARMTGIIGALFIVNCLALSVVFNIENKDSSLFDADGEVAPLTQTIPNREMDAENNTLSTDTTLTQPLTDSSDSSDETLPLAGETSAAETPSIEASPEVAEEPKKDE